MLLHTRSPCQRVQRAGDPDHSVLTLSPSGFCFSLSMITALLETAHDLLIDKSKGLTDHTISGLIFYPVPAPGVKDVTLFS